MTRDEAKFKTSQDMSMEEVDSLIDKIYDDFKRKLIIVKDKIDGLK